MNFLSLLTRFFMLVFLPAITSAMAGEGSGREVGNGGGAIVCRDSLSNVTFAQVYENWEYRALGIKESNDFDMATLVEMALTKVKKINPWLHELMVPELAKVSSGINLQIASGEAIALNNVLDSKHVTMPVRCPNNPSQRPQYEQVVNYLDDGRIFVDTEIYQSLSQRSLAALHLHEAIYKILRDLRGDTNSADARKLNAYLMADCDEPTLMSVMKNVLTGTQLAISSIIGRELDADILEASGKGDFELAFFLFSRQINLYNEVFGPGQDAINFARKEFLQLLIQKINDNDKAGLAYHLARRNGERLLIDGPLMAQTFSYVAAKYATFVKPRNICSPRPERRNEITCEVNRYTREKKRLLGIAKFLIFSRPMTMEFQKFWIDLPKDAMEIESITPIMFATLTGDLELTNYFLRYALDRDHPEFLNYSVSIKGQPRNASYFAKEYLSWIKRRSLIQLLDKYGVK
ncbi:MAG: hypothetical protein HYV97_08125 [Bdellovibrio sp.]|nr:hypothetical protein [Bdellovibrio sp.]